MRQLETLAAWTVGRDLARVAHSLSKTEPLCKDFDQADQIRRSARSIPANIAEGYALATRPQMIRHLRIALASAAELRWHFIHCADVELLPGEKCDHALSLTDREIGLLIGLLKKLGAKPRI